MPAAFGVLAGMGAFLAYQFVSSILRRSSLVSRAFSDRDLVTIEAMAASLPVVSVDGSGMRDIVEHGRQGFLIPNDPNALAAAIIELLSDSARMRLFRIRALRKAKTYQIDRMVDRLESVYEQAIEDKKRGKYVVLSDGKPADS